MFGYHKAKRERKRLKQDIQDFESKRNAYNAAEPEREKQANEQQRTQASERASQSAEDRKKARSEGRENILSLFNDPSIEGMSPERRKTMQYEANKQIQRSHQAADRKLLGEQSRRGILGKGGVGYAQQRDLQKMANEAQGQSIRDLDKLNEDLRMKKLAAIFAGEQGEAAQAQLDKQMAMDELRYEEEKKKNKYWEDYFNRQFSRI